MNSEPKKVVVIGGGTGTSVVLTGLKHTQRYDLTAIVVVSDHGGSTGRLRDEFGFLPVGDLRQCLASLAYGKYQDAIRNLLLYRFTKGEGLKGHNLGNLILTALEDLSTSPGKALETAAHIFRIHGSVLPVTEAAVDLVIEYEDGTIKIGETALDDPEFGGKRITNLKLSPRAKLYEPAQQALLEADAIILGPGDLYASLLANTLVEGFTRTLKKAPAPFLYVVNLMTHYAQTHGLTAADHVAAVSKYCGRTPDFVVIHQGSIQPAILKAYAQEKEYPVTDDLATTPYQVIRQDLIAKTEFKKTKGDRLRRSLLRHDSEKLAKVLMKVIG